MRPARTTESEARAREEIAETRRRFYEARRNGLSAEAAADFAHGRRAAPVDPAPQSPAGHEHEIPADWNDPKATPWFTLRSIAAKFTTEPVTNKAAATAVIEAELKRRAEATGA